MISRRRRLFRELRVAVSYTHFSNWRLTLCLRGIIQSPIAFYCSTMCKSIIYLVSLGDWVRYNSYSAFYRPSNTPANRSISLLEIPNRVANSCHPFTASITSETILSAVFRFEVNVWLICGSQEDKDINVVNCGFRVIRTGD